MNVFLVTGMDEVLKIALTEPLPGRVAPGAEPVEVEPTDDTITH